MYKKGTKNKYVTQQQTTATELQAPTNVYVDISLFANLSKL